MMNPKIQRRRTASFTNFKSCSRRSKPGTCHLLGLTTSRGAFSGTTPKVSSNKMSKSLCACSSTQLSKVLRSTRFLASWKIYIWVRAMIFWDAIRADIVPRIVLSSTTCSCRSKTNSRTSQMDRLSKLFSVTCVRKSSKGLMPTSAQDAGKKW